ncbi:MAG: helix-turn-helix domain-containing protein [Acidobacteria bacterium]|nr:helix-turn-helix domain-containing protein [Acidobacteriota bacterium]
MLEIAVIEDPLTAESSLHPVRQALLSALAEPASATAVARRLGLTRQQVNYHLRALETVGLVELAQERRRGNVTERLMVATARSYVISPSVLTDLAPGDSISRNRHSAQWMLALAARLVRDVGELLVGAVAANKRVETFAIDGELTFASNAERAGFAAELAEAVTRLTEKYHHPEASKGHKHRLVIALHPSVKPLRAPSPASQPSAQIREK